MTAPVSGHEDKPPRGKTMRGGSLQMALMDRGYGQSAGVGKGQVAGGRLQVDSGLVCRGRATTRAAPTAPRRP